MSRALYGFDKPLGVAWEATPFSFVADWFFPIGDYLKNLETSEFAGSLAVRNICHCVRATGTCDVLTYFDDTAMAKSGYYQTGTVEAHVFSRAAGLPSPTTHWDELRLPGVTQCILGGALTMQKF